MNRKLFISLMIVGGFFIPFLWSGWFLWWLFTKSWRDLSPRRVIWCILGIAVLVLMPAEFLVGYFFDPAIGKEYIRPIWEGILGISTLALLVGGLFMRPVVYPDDYYYDD